MFDRTLDDPRDRDDDRDRYPDPRDPDARERVHDPRDVFLHEVDLPRGPDREPVFHRGEELTLRGSEPRTLTSVGAFRVVRASDLRDRDDDPLDARSSELRHLREEGLVDTIRTHDRDDPIVFLTDRGRELLEDFRHDRDHDPRDDDHRQEFYAGVAKPRELEHDAQVFDAYLREAERLLKQGARIEHVALDYELKREYQQRLHERDDDHENGDGKPARHALEIERWAYEHDLPYFDDRVHFPDLQIEYLDADGRLDCRNVEVTTVHYRGGHAAAVRRSGFASYRGSTVRAGRRGSAFDPRLAEEVLG